MSETNPDQVMQTAVSAAKALLPGLEARRAELYGKLQEMDIQISRMRAIASILTEGQKQESQSPAQENIFKETQSTGVISKAPKGQAESQIIQVLERSPPLTAREIKENLQKSFGIDYNRSSIHQTLQRGLKAGKYKCEACKWSLVK